MSLPNFSTCYLFRFPSYFMHTRQCYVGIGKLYLHILIEIRDLNTNRQQYAQFQCHLFMRLCQFDLYLMPFQIISRLICGFIVQINDCSQSEAVI